MCIKVHNYTGTQVIEEFLWLPYINIRLLLSINLCAISLFIGQSRPLQQFLSPFYLYDCKACNYWNYSCMHPRIPQLVSRKYNKTCLHEPSPFVSDMVLMQIFFDVFSVNVVEELPWFRVITKIIPGIRWPSPPMLHQDEIQAHHQVIHSIFFQADKRV